MRHLKPKDFHIYVQDILGNYEGFFKVRVVVKGKQIRLIPYVRWVKVLDLETNEIIDCSELEKTLENEHK